MPQIKKWRPKKYSHLLQKILAVPILLEKYGLRPGVENLSFDLRTWSASLVFTHEDKTATFHAGVPGLEFDELDELIDQCFREWQALDSKEQAYYCEFQIPLEIMAPLVATELVTQGISVRLPTQVTVV